MAAKYVARFTVEIYGQQRSLFSVSENRADGALTLGLPGDYHRERGDGQDQGDPRTLRKTEKQYYSIHSSQNSVAAINTINHHKHFRGGEIYHRHLTKAIKSRDGFAHLFVRRSVDQRHPRHIAPANKGRRIKIGSYDPDFFTLIYAVVASARGVAFEIPDSALPGVSTVAISYEDFIKVRLTVLSTYVTNPSSARGFTGHNIIPGPADGQTAAGILSIFLTETHELMMEELMTLGVTGEEALEHARSFWLNKYGSPDHVTYLHYLMLCRKMPLLYGWLLPWPLS